MKFLEQRNPVKRYTIASDNANTFHLLNTTQRTTETLKSKHKQQSALSEDKHRRFRVKKKKKKKTKACGVIKRRFIVVAFHIGIVENESENNLLTQFLQN